MTRRQWRQAEGDKALETIFSVLSTKFSAEETKALINALDNLTRVRAEAAVDEHEESGFHRKYDDYY